MKPGVIVMSVIAAAIVTTSCGKGEKALFADTTIVVATEDPVRPAEARSAPSASASPSTTRDQTER